MQNRQNMQKLLNELYSIDSFNSGQKYEKVNHIYKEIDSDLYYPTVFKQLVDKIIDQNMHKREIIDLAVRDDDQFKQIENKGEDNLPKQGILIHSIYNDKLYWKKGTERISADNYQSWRNKINMLLHKIDDESQIREYLYGHRARELNETQREFVVNWLYKNQIAIKAVEYPVIRELYKRGDEREGNISKDYGQFIYNLMIESKIKNSVEIGLGYGSTSLFICAAHMNAGYEGGYHIAIDPDQNSKWRGIGINNIKKLGYSGFRLIENPSYIALPKLLNQLIGESKKMRIKFDPNYSRVELCVVGGWNDYNLTLIDLFYCDLILKVGGLLILTDQEKSAIDELKKFIGGNWKHYSRIDTVYKSYHVYKKSEDDKRSWAYVQNLFNEMI